MNKPELVYVTYIETTPEKVWEALTDGNFSRKYWFGSSVESTWEIGAPVIYTDTNNNDVDIRGEVLRVEPPNVLSYTFDNRRGNPGEQASRVTFNIEKVLDLVKLTVTHDNFAPDSKVIDGVRQGWPALLAGLKTLLETGRAITDSKAIFSCGKAEAAA